MSELENNMEPVSSYVSESSDSQYLQNVSDKIVLELNKVIIGQDDLVELLILGLFSNGHILIEGVPGVAKTLSSKMLAQAISADFNRIQFTPDLMPSDVTGTMVFNMSDSSFRFNKGPIFSNIVLIDEINRAPAKTQASLFEVMEERQVTVDGTTHKMGYPFVVIATQNPIEQEGTYRLPEAQLDRFLFKVKVAYPNISEERLILNRFKGDFDQKVTGTVGSVLTKDVLERCREIVEKVYIKDEIIDYIAEIVVSTRTNGDLFLGASPRASMAILKSAKANAALNGRDFVTPDDVQRVCVPVLNHRIALTPEREMEGMLTDEVIEEIIRKIEVPR